jgi:hypothetical protein
MRYEFDVQFDVGVHSSLTAQTMSESLTYETLCMHAGR